MKRLLRGVLLVILLAGCVGGSGQAAFLSATQSLNVPEQERLGSGNLACDYLDDFRVEFHEPLGEPYHYAFDDLYRAARNAGATLDQALDLTGAAVSHLCPFEDYVDAWESWLRTADIETLLNE